MSGIIVDGNTIKHFHHEPFTEVIFRKFGDGSIIALFPKVLWNGDGDCTGYMHVGQHGAADFNGVIRMTKHATTEESQALQKELEDIGYKLIVRRRR